MEAENEDLRAELDAFDPAFFEELEDLKHDRHALAQRCAHVRPLLHQTVFDVLPTVVMVSYSGEMPVQSQGLLCVLMAAWQIT